MATYMASAVQAISDTAAHYIAWAQSFGGGFTTCSWAAQTGHGEVPATGTGASYAWTTAPSIVPSTLLLPVRQYRFNGAFVPSNTYVGANAQDSATVTDLVTSGGITYVHITATSSLATVPASDTTNWQPYFYEIWKSAGSNTSSLPIYVRIVYTVAATGNTGPAIHLSIGTGIDANGNITGGINTSNAAPLTNAIVRVGSSGQSATGNMLFSGNSDNFRFITWQGLNADPYQWMLSIDRSKTASGTDTNAFVQVHMQYPIAGTQTGGGAVIPNSSLSNNPLTQVMGQGTGMALPGLVIPGNIANTSMLNFGTTPPLLIYPLVGFEANPVMGLIGFANPDIVDGNVMPVWIYGASHSYIVSSKRTGQATGPWITGIQSVAAPAILWE